MSERENRKRRSRAEVLYCLDVLIRQHFNDEEHTERWLVDGIPDGTLVKPPTDEQVEPYFEFLDDEDADLGYDYFNYDYFVKLAVSMLYRECFKTRYEKESLV